MGESELRLTALEGEKERKKKKNEGDEERRNVRNKNQMSTTTISDEHDLIPAATGADWKNSYSSSEKLPYSFAYYGVDYEGMQKNPGTKTSKAISKTQQSKPHNSPTNHPKGTYKKKKDKNRGKGKERKRKQKKKKEKEKKEKENRGKEKEKKTKNYEVLRIKQKRSL